jgi:GTPase SAR1 family protein
MDGKDLKKKKSKGQLEAPPPPSLEFKVEILGPGSVGKSALLKQLCFGGFTDEYKVSLFRKLLFRKKNCRHII